MGIFFANRITFEYEIKEIAPDQWISDDLHSECMTKYCNKKFSTTQRKHHCRFCGYIICRSCSKKRYHCKRICDECYIKHMYFKAISAMSQNNETNHCQQASMNHITEAKNDLMAAINDMNVNDARYTFPETFECGNITPVDVYNVNVNEIDRHLLDHDPLYLSVSPSFGKRKCAHAPISIPETDIITPCKSNVSTPYTDFESITTDGRSRTFLLLSDDDFLTQNEDIYQDVPEYEEDGILYTETAFSCMDR